jgi:TPP-dependent pyruvate/acetoin dehydrogenase alpha subunit
MDTAEYQTMIKNIGQEINFAWQFAKESPFPDKEELTSGLYYCKEQNALD